MQFAGDLRAHADRGHRRRRRVPRPVRRRRAQGGHGQEDGGQPADPRAGQPQTRRSRRKTPRPRPDLIIATGRTDYPNQVNNVLVPLHLPRRAGLRRHHHHGGDGDRRGLRAGRTGAGGAQRGGTRLCAASSRPSARVPDPQALRPAPDDQDRARGRQGGGGQRRGRARSRTWTPTASSCKASSTPPARP